MGNENNNQAGNITPFMLDNIPIRGKILRLDDLIQHIPSLEKGKTIISHSLSELIAASAIMATDLKQGADITLQLHSDSNISLMVAQCNGGGFLRAYANFEGNIKDMKFADIATEKSLFAVTVECPDAQEPFQSLVHLNSSSLSKTIERYFNESVQLKTYFKVFSGKVNDKICAGAIFIQAMPENGEEISTDDWNRIGIILSTIQKEEILPGTLSSRGLLMRLFAEDTIRVFPNEKLVFSSEETRKRMEKALKSIGMENCKELLKEGNITMTCEFTGREETFTNSNLMKIFGNSWLGKK